MTLQDYFYQVSKHREEHHCGGYPYEHADVLAALIASIKAQRVLELGTGLGYTSLYLAVKVPSVTIDTIDKDESHLAVAKKYWEEFGAQDRITALQGRAQDILPTLPESYDLIFFDGYVPQMKFLLMFEKLLKKGGLLVTANLFLRDPQGGTYLRQLKNEKRWKTGVFSDTAVSVKLF